MKLLEKFKRGGPVSRREMAASRRAASSDIGHESQTFRRGRTVSTRSTASPEDSRRQLDRATAARRRKIFSVVGAILALVVAIIFVLNQMVYRVDVVTPGQSKVDNHTQERYRQALDGYLSSRPLERLRFLLDGDALQVYLLEHAPEVQSASVIAKDGAAFDSSLRLSFRQPALKWVSSGKEYYVDGLGVTYEINYYDTPVLSVEDQSGVDPGVGQAVVNRSFLSFLGQSVSQFDAAGQKVDRVILPEGTVRQVSLGIEGRSYVVKLTLDRGVEEQVQRAIKAIGYLDERGLSPEYIDARVDQRVFYK